MVINKKGFYHTVNGINNQDFGFECEKFKCVVDGCSEGKHSEVGAKLFCKLLEEELIKDPAASFHESMVKNIYEKLIDAFVTKKEVSYPKYIQDIIDYLLFTILILEERADSFQFHICGDGGIIKQLIGNHIKLEVLNYSHTPIYYAYKFIDPEYLKVKSETVIQFEHKSFSKTEFMNIGIATDGIRFIIGSEAEQEFSNLIALKKERAIERFIIKNQKLFEDDITLVF